MGQIHKEQSAVLNRGAICSRNLRYSLRRIHKGFFGNDTQAQKTPRNATPEESESQIAHNRSAAIYIQQT